MASPSWARSPRCPATVAHHSTSPGCRSYSLKGPHPALGRGDRTLASRLPTGAKLPGPAMLEESPNAELARIRRERDLYRRRLHLGEQNELEPLLEQALGLVVDVTSARQGYLELHDDEERAGDPPLWIAHGFS